MGLEAVFAAGLVACLLFCDTGDDPSQQCPGLSSPTYGNVHCNGYRSGSTCSFTCLPGFELSGGNTLICQGSQWSGNTPQCNRIQCPPFTDKPSGISYACSNGFNYESLCNFDCDRPGYSTCGDYNYCYGQQRICRADGTWSGWYPTCFDREAPVLECPESREVIADRGYTTAMVQWDPPKVTDNSWEVITPIITEGLSSGSTFSDGSSYIQYKATDSAGNRAVCGFSITVKVKKCIPHKPVSSQQVHCSRDTVWGSTCAFTCSAGYCLQGAPQVTCEASTGVEAGRTQGRIGNGVERRSASTKVDWNSRQPSCQRMACPALVLPAHGRLVDPDGCANTYGSTCRVACDSGYEIVGTSVLQCSANVGDQCWEGFWEGEFSCALTTCTQPYLPHQAVITNPDGCDNTVKAKEGTVCQYACNTGYILLGEETLTCTSEGEWSHRFPRCQIVECDSRELPAPSNGYKIGCTAPLIEFGIGCLQGCNIGFMPTQIQYVTCNDGGNGRGEWSDTTLTCENVKCDPPPTTTNSLIVSCTVGRDTNSINEDINQYHQVGSTCTFACSQGYISQGGESRRTCTNQGNWNGIPLSCSDINAPVLSCPISKTYYAGRGKTYTDISYEWEPVQASDLGSTINATLVYIGNERVTQTRSRFTEGDHILSYQASDSAGNLATCSMYISVRVTRCSPISTNGLTELVPRYGSCLDRPVYGTECAVRCKDGYHYQDNSDSVTQVCERYSPSHTDGYWSGRHQSCQANTCSIPSIRNGYTSGCSSTSVSLGQTCQFHCNFGYEDTNGRGYMVPRTCQNDGTWSGPELQCGAIQCLGFNRTFSQGHISPSACLSSSLSYQSVCAFSCDNGYHLHGAQSMMCLGWGSWSDTRSPVCEDVSSPVFDGACPRTVNVNTERNQRTASVSFSAPTATDNSGELPVVSRHDGNPGPGQHFEEGQTRVMYIAEDGTGNSARCDVIVNVQVRRCSSVSSPSSGTVTCSNGVIHGSTCSFTCTSGYLMRGSASRTCEINSNGEAYWTGTQPQCSAISCPAIPTRANVIRVGCNPPPTRSIYGTTCYWYCPAGYKATGNPTSQCQEDGTWDVDNFSCQSSSCPPVVVPRGLEVFPTDCQTATSSVGNNCIFSCPRSGYRVYPAAAEEVFCRNSGEWSQTNVQCEDFERPRFTKCPGHQLIYADRNQLSATVDWDVAADDNSGAVPRVTCDMNKGDVQAEGNHHVACIATDAAGNQAYCAFIVSIRVHRCPHLNPPHFGRFISSACGNHFGSTCQAACDSGYVLQGSNQMSCQRDEDTDTTYWQYNGEPPVCQYQTCSPLLNIISGDYGGIYPSFCQSQITAPSAGTICHLYCSNGYSLQNILQPTVTCQADGSWDIDVSGLSPYCQDDTRPQLRSCPGPQYISLDANSRVARGTFEIPEATDNSQEELAIIKSPADITSPYDFRESTLVSYTFYDAALNSVTCSFYVNVIVDIPPIVSFCPDDILETGTSVAVTWDPPVFSHPVTMSQVPATCNLYSPATFNRGSSTVRCVSSLPYNVKSSVCEFKVEVEPESCDPLNAPDNGALTCDMSSVGEFCYFFCNANYDVPYDVAGVFEAGVPFLCRHGSWVPNYPVPDCAVPAIPSAFSLPVEFYYISDQDCNNPSVQESLKDAFNALIESSELFGTKVCSEESCATDIKITCGPTASRRRRDSNTDVISGNDEGDLGYQKLMEHAQKKIQEWMDVGEIPILHLSGRRIPSKEALKSAKGVHKRETNGPFELTIHVNMDMTFNPDQNTDVAEQAWTQTDDFISTLLDIYDESLNGNVIPRVPGASVSSRLQDGYPMFFDSRDLIAKCPPGYAGKSGNSFLCSPCFPGTYAADFKCLACQIGSYQDQTTQSLCKICPNGKSTLRIGARDISECIDTCPPGQHSDTGLMPCVNCPKGSYQPNYGATQCTECPSGQGTEQDGSQFLSNCKDLCQPGSSSSAGVEPCAQCSLHSYQPGAGQTECIPCPDGKVTVAFGVSDVTQCIDNTICDTSPCQNGATCYKDPSRDSGGRGYICACPPGYEGLRCHIDINECSSNPCFNGGVCLNGPNAFVCNCPDGYEGVDCSIDKNECTSQPCANGGTCTNTQGSFSCMCREGFLGTLCQIDFNECGSSPCQNQGTCYDREGAYGCSCKTGYTGENCESDINECLSSPCEHGGLCVNYGGGFNCSCHTGYTGKFCEIDVDLCANSPCADGATCLDLEKKFTCVCPPGKTGSKCEDVIDPCGSSPCQRGTCKTVEIAQDGMRGSVGMIGYRCICPAGYAGTHCDEDIDECASSPCSNAGICVDGVNGYSCICTDGYEGLHCETPKNPCDSNPCGLGTCSQENDGYTCACPPGSEGEQCEKKVPVCSRDTCQNGGQCRQLETATNSDVLCVCPSGYTGSTCNVNANECVSNPCVHGQCRDAVNSFSCTCDEGFTGETCEVDINECVGVVCQNSGTCIDKVNGFLCDCRPGFEGILCGIDTDDCIENNCVHGSCVDGINSYECVCDAGFLGEFCNEERDECVPNPCSNGGACTDKINRFECTCAAGLGGEICDINLNECLSNPCQNGATCTDVNRGYICACAPGYTGSVCSVNIDECASAPCLHFATCVDGINKFVCRCPPGFKGKSCQIDQGPCQPNPCGHGGTCYVRTNGGYTCVCIDGYTGKNCGTIMIDMCENNACENGGKCVAHIDSYECQCPLGYSGEFCEASDDVCAAFPCENGGTCRPPNNDGAKMRCDCIPGYTGSQCEMDIDNCNPNPCLHHGTCTDGLNQYTCQCAPGYSGRDCSDNVNECQSGPCSNSATCTDLVNGYACVCPHGFEGDLCQYAYADFDFVIESSEQSVELINPFNGAVNGLTLAFWVKAQNGEGNMFSYHQLDDNGDISTTDIEVFDPQDVTVMIKGYEFKSGISINDNRWHHVTIVWDGQRGRTTMYLEGIIGSSGRSPLLVGAINGQGLLVVSSNVTGASFAGSLSHINMWDFIVSTTSIQDISSQCGSSQPGNIVAPIDFSTTRTKLLQGATIQRPSMCDDFNNCQNNPCLNSGECIDEINGYTCKCLLGYTGINCETNTNDCVNHNCQNSAQCVDGIASYRCNCLDGFIGEFCEARKVCDPLPIDDSNLSANCNGDGSIVDKVCTVTCQEGYDISMSDLAEFRCGPTSDYNWVQENNDNVELTIPTCTGVTTPTVIVVDVDLNFTQEIDCTSTPVDNEKTSLQLKIRQATGEKATALSCVQTGRCEVETDVKVCEDDGSKGGRRRRSTPDVSKPSIKIKLRRAISSLGYQNDQLATAESDLEEAVTTIIDTAKQGGFDVTVNNHQYGIDTDSGQVTGDFACERGSVKSHKNVACVPCQTGTYWSNNKCKACPSGTTSPRGATAINQCTCKYDNLLYYITLYRSI